MITYISWFLLGFAFGVISMIIAIVLLLDNTEKKEDKKDVSKNNKYKGHEQNKH